jgi:hypothetical protein
MGMHFCCVSYLATQQYGTQKCVRPFHLRIASPRNLEQQHPGQYTPSTLQLVIQISCSAALHHGPALFYVHVYRHVILCVMADL